MISEIKIEDLENKVEEISLIPEQGNGEQQKKKIRGPVQRFNIQIIQFQKLREEKKWKQFKKKKKSQRGRSYQIECSHQLLVQWNFIIVKYQG